MIHLVEVVRNMQWGPAGASLLIIVIASLVGLITNRLVFRIVERLSRATKNRFDDKVAKYGRRPGSLLFPTLFLSFVTPSLHLSTEGRQLYRHGLSLLSIAAGTYLALNLTALARDVLVLKVDPNSNNALSVRKIVTQVRVAEKLLIFVILVCSFAFMLMTFDSIRQVGVSILASAGVAGIIVGLAAQRSIGTLLAGIQIAMTHPIRIDDVVVVEGEWGTIEEITLTYVVVKIWDQRRLVVPITYFMEKPFQNWTRSSTELVGTVFLYTDYTVPVDRIREELENIVKPSPWWDARVCKVQVTDAKQSTVELRCCVSAANASDLWDLRCLVREKLIAYVQKSHASCLPRLRATLDQVTAATAGSTCCTSHDDASPAAASSCARNP